MAAGLILEFEGVTDAEYEAVNRDLGIDATAGTGDWPDGLVTHTAGLDEDGHLVLLEVWESQDQQATFMEGRLAAALEQAGVPPPSSITWIEVLAHHHPGA